MAFPQTAWQQALAYARRGKSANAYFASLRSAGIGIRRQTALQLYSAATSVVTKSRGEAFANVNSRPGGQNISTWPTARRAGYGQTVALVYRERGTGQIKTVYHTTFTQKLVTRATAMQNAVAAYDSNADEYEQELIGVSYQSTYKYTPFPEGS